MKVYYKLTQICEEELGEPITVAEWERKSTLPFLPVANMMLSQVVETNVMEGLEVAEVDYHVRDEVAVVTLERLPFAPIDFEQLATPDEYHTRWRVESVNALALGTFYRSLFEADKRPKAEKQRDFLAFMRAHRADRKMEEIYPDELIREAMADE